MVIVLKILVILYNSLEIKKYQHGKLIVSGIENNKFIKNGIYIFREWF